MDVLKKINKLRLDRKWSVYRLSLASGISQSTLTNMFNRETLPSITTLECLCDAFGITMSEFFSDEAAPPTNSEEHLLLLYRNASPEAQRAVSTILYELAKGK